MGSLLRVDLVAVPTACERRTVLLSRATRAIFRARNSPVHVPLLADSESMTPRSTSPVSCQALSSAAAISFLRLSTRSRIAAICASVSLNSRVSVALLTTSRPQKLECSDVRQGRNPSDSVRRKCLRKRTRSESVSMDYHGK